MTIYRSDYTEAKGYYPTLVASYEYDPWGKVTRVKGSVGTTLSLEAYPNHIAHVNPIRYRGYYYDTETGFYYLQSRYYDPAISRFINADGLLDTDYFLGCNTFAYCGNNPVIYTDSTGYGRTYVIYYDNVGTGFYDQAMNSPYYDSKNKDVYMIDVTTGEDFVNAWNGMQGTIDNVYLYLHGGKGALYFKGESLRFSGNANFNNLESKDVEKRVYLFSCKGGAGEEGNNVAWMFSKLTSAPVIACTGSVSFSKLFGKYYARKALDWGIMKTFYYQKKYIFWGAYVAKSILGAWG